MLRGPIEPAVRTGHRADNMPADKSNRQESILKEKNWLRFAAEACVIVVSILLAFGIDAWWDELKEGHREQAYLVSLRADVIETIHDNERVKARQLQEQERILSIAEMIRSGAELPADIRTTFPTVVLPAESMDAYRDLVASGGTTLLSSEEVRGAMANLLQRIEYNDRAERWALDVATSARMIVLSSEPGSMNRDHLSDIWVVYVDIGERLIEGKNRLDESAKNALAALDASIGRMD